MTATTPVAFDPKPRKLGEVRSFKAASAILAGQIVAFAASGVSDTVAPATSSLSSPVGVALYSQATTGGYVAVAGNDSELMVMLSADDGTADAGDWVGVSTVAGTAIVQDGAIAAHTGEGAGLYPVGQCLEDIAAGSATVGGKGYIRVQMTPIWTAAS